MCRLKSAIILKDRIFIPDYDNHNNMLDELGIDDSILNAERLFVRAELYPKNGDAFSPVESWEFCVDQDILPDWFIEDYEKGRMIDAVKKWAKGRIHIGENGLFISEGSNHFIKNCKNVEIRGTAMVSKICGDSTVSSICQSAIVKKISDSTTVKSISGSAVIQHITDSVKVADIFENATIDQISGNANVSNIRENVMVKNISENSEVKNIFGDSDIWYISGDSVVGNIYENARVKEILGNVTVDNISGNVSVKRIYDNVQIGYICLKADIANIYGNCIIKHILNDAKIKDISDNVTVKEICNDVVIKSVRGDATIVGSIRGWNNKVNVVLSDNAVFKDVKEKVIYFAGEWKIKLVKNTKK